MTDSGELSSAPAPTSARARFERSDADLVRAVRAGSDAAAEELVARHWDRAYRIAFAILGDPHFAEDVTQEAMISILANLGRFDSRRSSCPGCTESSPIGRSIGPGRGRDASRSRAWWRHRRARRAMTHGWSKRWQLRNSWTKGSAADGQPAYVLVVGPVPGGGRYELITYQPKAAPRQHAKLEGPCFELDLTQRRNSFGGSCGVLPEGPVMALAGVDGNSAPGEEIFALSGRVSPAVKSVEATLNGRPIAVELAPIPAELIQRFQLGQPFGFFIAFLTGKLEGGPIAVTARGQSGQALARRTVEAPDIVAVQIAGCEIALVAEAGALERGTGCFAWRRSRRVGPGPRGGRGIAYPHPGLRKTRGK